MLALFFFIFGTIVGSFLHVVVERLPKSQSIVYPPSHCPHCRHRLAWYDLIPVISFALLKGKCRYCHVHISYYYPLVEIVTGLIFAGIYLFSVPMGLLAVFYLLAVSSIFISIFFTDYKYGIIPLYSVLLGCLIVLMYLVFTEQFSTILNHVLSGIGAFAFFFFLFAVTKGRGMGFGDVMLVILLGLFLGFPLIALAIYLSFLTGAIISLFLIMTGIKKLRHDSIPFGPFLISGTFIALFYGDTLVTMVMKYLYVS